MALDSDRFGYAWSLDDGDLVGIEIPQSPVNENIGTYGFRSIGTPSITIASGAFALAYLLEVEDDANRDNVELLWIQQVAVDLAPTHVPLGVVRGSGAASSENAYMAWIAPDSEVLIIGKLVAGVLSAVAFTAFSLPDDPEDYYIRFRANGTTLKARAWRYDAVEPSTWQVEGTDSDVTGAGYIGLGFAASLNTGGFGVPGFVSVGTNGESAPRPRTDAEIRRWVNDDSNYRVVLAEIGVLGQLSTGHANASVVLMANWPFVTKGSDSPPDQVYDDIIVKVPTLRAAANEQLVGRSTLSFGDLVVKNEDGVRNAWLSWNWDGRECDILLGGVGWRKWDFFRVLSATVQEVYAPRQDQIGFKIRDKGAVLNRKMQTEVVGGSEADAGAPQPIPLGRVFNIEPVLKDHAALRYKFADADLSGATGITDVRDGGLTVAYTADLANGELTLTSSPTGRVTMDVTNDLADGSVTKSGNTHRRALQTIIEDRCELGAGSTYLGARSGSLANFATDAPIGLYLRDEANAIDVMDEIVISAGGFWYPNAQGLFCAAQLRIPSAPYDHVLLEDDLLGDLAIDKILLPAEVAQLGYLRNWTPQPDGLVGGVSAANRALYGAQAQFTAIAPTYTSLDQPANHALRRRLKNRIALFQDAPDAETEVARLDAIYRKTCAIASFTTRFNGPFYDLGESLHLTHSKYGFEGGRAGVIVSFEKMFGEASARLRVFFQVGGAFPVTTVAVPYPSAEDFY